MLIRNDYQPVRQSGILRRHDSQPLARISCAPSYHLSKIEFSGREMSRRAKGKQFLQCRPWPLVTTKRRGLTSDNHHFLKALLDLKDDDPQAVDMALRYLYQLDYPSLTVAEVSTVPARSESPGDKPTTAEAPDLSPHFESPALAEEVSKNLWSYDEFVEDLPQIATEANAPQPWPDERVLPAEPEPEPEIDPVPAAEHVPEHEAMTDFFSRFLSQSTKGNKKIAVWEDELEPEPPAPEPPAPEPPAEWPPAEDVESVDEVPPSQRNMLLHARVYVLAVKYGIKGLQDLALSKLSAQAAKEWHTKEFLRTIDEVYDSYSGVEGIRSIKYVMVRTFASHLDLLDKEEAVATLRGRDVAADLLLHLHRTLRMI